jgi:hypothetical protein
VRVWIRVRRRVREGVGGEASQSANLVGGDEVIAMHSGGHGGLVQPAADELRSIRKHVSTAAAQRRCT